MALRRRYSGGSWGKLDTDPLYLKQGDFRNNILCISLPAALILHLINLKMLPFRKAAAAPLRLRQLVKQLTQQRSITTHKLNTGANIPAIGSWKHDYHEL